MAFVSFIQSFHFIAFIQPSVSWPVLPINECRRRKQVGKEARSKEGKRKEKKNGRTKDTVSHLLKI